MWTCVKCGSKVDPGFDVCWKCGTSVEGVEDPTFTTADEAVDESSVTDLGLSAAPPFESVESAELVDCYSAADYLEARFLADQLNERGIQAIADGFDFHEAIGSMNSNPRVRVRADQHQAARDWLEEYERNRPKAEGSSVLDD